MGMNGKSGGRRRALGLLGMLGILVLAACESDSMGPGADLDAASAEAIALFVLDVDATAGWSATVLADPRSGRRDFTRVGACPAGGTRSMTGEGTASLDATTRILTTTWSTTLNHDACAFFHSRRGQGVTRIIDGSVTASGTATYQMPTERPGQRELLSYTATRVGSTTTTVGDQSRTCDVNVTETYDAGTGTFTVTGTVCAREVNATRTPGGRRDG